MLDLKWIRENPADLDKALVNRKLDPISAKLLEMDERRRELQTQLQTLQNERNQLAKAIGAAKAQKQEVPDLVAKANRLKEDLPQLEAEERVLGDELHLLLASLPNVPRAEVPVGADESDNKLIHSWGDPAIFDFQPKRHFELGEELGLMDFEAAAKMSGSRFVVLRGALARLERALTQFMLDVQTKESGYEEVSPPILVQDQAFFGGGLLPKFAENAFQTTNGHWLIPTAEVSLTNLVREQILDPQVLPLRFTAATPCFRSEAGAAGRDTRGMIRQHQFYKVELVSICHPDAATQEHERMTSCAEEILKRLNLPFRRVLLCTGDMGQQSEKTYDLEVWLPGEQAYREIASCSTCGDYQARRMNARFREIEGGANEKSKMRFVHTLNGSGLAVGRTLVAVLENYQTADGSIRIPDCLLPYMDGLKEITK